MIVASKEKKKPSLAVVIEMGKKKPAGDDSESEMSGDESSEDYEAAVGELADVLGVAEDQRDAFYEAFKAAVMSCM